MNRWAMLGRPWRDFHRSNLSEPELALGELAGAAGDAGQSVTYADRRLVPFRIVSFGIVAFTSVSVLVSAREHPH